MKYVKYILILIMLIGIFSPMMQVNAEDLGTCTVVDKSGEKNVRTETFLNISESDCNKKAYPPFFTVNWTKNTSPPAPQQPQKLTPAGAGTTPTPASTTGYQLLAPLPELCPSGGTTPCTVDTTTGGLGKYLNLMIKIFIGLCAVLSVVMIVIGGLEYMTSELISSKEAGKEKITGALLGLLIALGAYALLFTINPDLLKSDVNVPPVVLSTPTFVGDDGKLQVLNGKQQGSGNYCAVVLEHLQTRKGQVAQTATSEFCKPTLEECQKQISYYRSSNVLKSCYQKNN